MKSGAYGFTWVTPVGPLARWSYLVLWQTAQPVCDRVALADGVCSEPDRRERIWINSEQVKRKEKKKEREIQFDMWISYFCCRFLASECCKGSVFLRVGKGREACKQATVWKKEASLAHHSTPVGEDSDWLSPEVFEKVLLLILAELGRQVPDKKGFGAARLDRFLILVHLSAGGKASFTDKQRAPSSPHWNDLSQCTTHALPWFASFAEWNRLQNLRLSNERTQNVTFRHLKKRFQSSALQMTTAEAVSRMLVVNVTKAVCQERVTVPPWAWTHHFAMRQWNNS